MCLVTLQCWQSVAKLQLLRSGQSTGSSSSSNGIHRPGRVHLQAAVDSGCTGHRAKHSAQVVTSQLRCRRRVELH